MTIYLSNAIQVEHVFVSQSSEESSDDFLIEVNERAKSLPG
jgi:hypothetical protein